MRFLWRVLRSSNAVFVPLKKIKVVGREVQLFAVFDAFGSNAFSERSDGLKKPAFAEDNDGSFGASRRSAAPSRRKKRFQHSRAPCSS